MICSVLTESLKKVTISTCHAAKGLEWPVVMVPAGRLPPTFPGILLIPGLSGTRNVSFLSNWWCRRRKVGTCKRRLGNICWDYSLDDCFMLLVLELNPFSIYHTPHPERLPERPSPRSCRCLFLQWWERMQYVQVFIYDVLPLTSKRFARVYSSTARQCFQLPSRKWSVKSWIEWNRTRGRSRSVLLNSKPPPACLVQTAFLMEHQ